MKPLKNRSRLYIAAERKKSVPSYIMYINYQNIDIPPIYMGTAYPGLRIAEAMALKEKDIHREHGDININRQTCHDVGFD